MATVLIENRINPRRCRHDDVEPLGNDGKAQFSHCANCGSILIAHGIHRWIIRPTDEAGPLAF